jgi:hypothetical protein
MIEGIGGAGLGTPQLQSPQGRKSAETGSGSAISSGNSVIDASGSQAVGPSDVPSPQAVNQAPSVTTPGPKNDFGHRGSLLNIAA